MEKDVNYRVAINLEFTENLELEKEIDILENKYDQILNFLQYLK